jgi:uncharacterized protein YbjT (DUF2867 family)
MAGVSQGRRDQAVEKKGLTDRKFPSLDEVVDPSAQSGAEPGPRAESVPLHRVASPAHVLVLGATGYIGGLLVPRLLALGHFVRVFVRDPKRLAGREWASRVEVVEGDVLDLESLSRASRGMDAAYYLVHSMGSEAGSAFVQRDRHAASNMALIAREAGLNRLIYLGGLGERTEDLSEHLASRQEVGRVLAAGGAPVTEFRAAVIVGAKSISFRMVRYLAERLPIMVAPKWVSTRIQPIAENDVLRYLVDALAQPESAGKVIEIGGADVLTYGEMITVYARIRGLRRELIPVPVLTPAFSSYWVSLTTPIPSSIARPLIEGLKTEVIVKSPLAHELFPFEPVGYEEAVRRVLALDPDFR